MYFYCKTRGFTLIELIVTFAVLVIIATLAVPTYQDLKARQELKTVTSVIKQFVSSAKSNAVIYHSIIVVCSSSNLTQCTNDQWNTGVIMFSDQNNNEKVDSNERIHSTVSMQLNYGSLKWVGGFSSRKILTFQGDTGVPRGASGSFHYCSRHDSQLNKRIVIAPMGHTRDEPLTCS